MATSAGRPLSSLVCKLLAQRDPGDAPALLRYLEPKLNDLTDPFLMPNMEAAIERILHAIDQKQNVVLYGDYDVDGVSSLALLKTLLEAYGLNPRCFLPLRMSEGYGVSRGGLTRCLTLGPMDLLIAVDCGTTSRTECEWLEEQGIRMIVLDHHEPDPARLPPCPVVNPKLGTDWHYLCSAGVVFKVAHALGKKRKSEHFELKEHLDLVALATVADIVPLVAENRLLVRKGLTLMSNTTRAGLRALIEISGVTLPLDSTDLGFRLGPRLNAAGRLDSAQTSLDLLLSPDRETAVAIAQELDRQNRERQTLEHAIQQEASVIAAEMVASEPPSMIIAARGWHPGVVGIVAARLTRKFHRPVFTLAIDEAGEARGSGRSVDGLSLVAALDACRDLLVAGGGHEAAAGMTIREENLPAFRERFAAAIASQIRSDELVPKIYIDAETRLNELTLEFLHTYELLAPFGQGNPRPLFMARGVEAMSEPRLLKERHWKFDFYQDGTTKGGVWFNGGHEMAELPEPPWDVAFYVDRNTFRGETTVQLLVQYIRTSGDI